GQGAGAPTQDAGRRTQDAGRRTQDAERSATRPVPRQAVGVADAGAAEEVQGRAEGQVDPAGAQAIDQGEVVQVAAAAGVDAGQGGPLAEALHQRLVDAAA